MFFLLLGNVGCASESLYVKVVDDEGRPVSNATVNVDFTSSHVVFGEGTDHHYEAKTDSNGNAVVKFNCTSSDFAWSVEADGYYRSDLHTENFKGEDVIIPPGIGHVVLHEHDKRGGGDSSQEEKSSAHDGAWRVLRGRSAFVSSS